MLVNSFLHRWQMRGEMEYREFSQIAAHGRFKLIDGIVLTYIKHYLNNNLLFTFIITNRIFMDLNMSFDKIRKF